MQHYSEDGTTVVFPKEMDTLTFSDLVMGGTYVLPEKCDKIVLDNNEKAKSELREVKLIIRSNSPEALDVKKRFEKVIANDVPSINYVVIKKDIEK